MRIPLLVTLMTSSLLGLGCGGAPKSAAAPAATAVEPAPTPTEPPVVGDEPADTGETTGTMMATEEGRMGRKGGETSAPDGADPAAPDGPVLGGTGGGWGGGAGPGSGPGGAPPPTTAARVTPEVVVGTPTVTGGKLTPAGVRVIVKRQQARLSYCYERELLVKPHLAGMVTISFTVNALGYVAEASVSKTTLQEASAEKCLVEVVKKFEFGKQSAPKTTISYPFIFKTTR